MGLDGIVEVLAHATPTQVQPCPCPSPFVLDTEQDFIFVAVHDICEMLLDWTSEGRATILSNGDFDDDGDGHSPFEQEVYTHLLPSSVLPAGQDSNALLLLLLLLLLHL